jgi:hypothetical protein
MPIRYDPFKIVPGLGQPEFDEFESWLLSYSARDEIMTSVMLEYENIRRTGLTRDTARYFYEEAYETHVVKFEDLDVYFLFLRPIANNVIVSLGQSPMMRGEPYAINLVYQRACQYLNVVSMKGYRIQ